MLRTALVGIALAAAMLVAGSPISAQSMPGHDMKQGMPMAAMPSADMVDGEVRKVDKAAKKITLRHAEMPHLEMPGMTMVFQVKDPAMLDSVKVGDKVRFKALKMGGAFVVVELEPAK